MVLALCVVLILVDSCLTFVLGWSEYWLLCNCSKEKAAAVVAAGDCCCCQPLDADNKEVV